VEWGFSDSRFWRLTPREFRALSDRLVDRERRSDARFGVVASVAANLMGGKRGGGQFQPSDFFASLSDQPQQPAYRASDEDVAAGWQSWALQCQTVQGGG
jgi:hypothetical protein